MGRLIEVDEGYFKAIERDSHFLECLDACGLPSWDGYKEAKEMYDEEAGINDWYEGGASVTSMDYQ